MKVSKIILGITAIITLYATSNENDTPSGPSPFFGTRPVA